MLTATSKLACIVLFVCCVIAAAVGQTKETYKGYRAFADWVAKHYKISKAMRRAHLYGKTVVGYTVDTTGRLVDFTVIEDLGFGTAEELIRVLDLSNEKGYRWSPGIADGKKVPVAFSIPIAIDTR